MKTENPYPKNTIEYYEWKLEQLGFNQAQIRLILTGDQRLKPEPDSEQPGRRDKIPLTV